jgi:hypothetical protein
MKAAIFKFLFMFEHVALMATLRVLTQCVMITGIKNK